MIEIYYKNGKLSKTDVLKIIYRASNFIKQKNETFLSLEDFFQESYLILLSNKHKFLKIDKKMIKRYLWRYLLLKLYTYVRKYEKDKNNNYYLLINNFDNPEYVFMKKESLENFLKDLNYLQAFIFKNKILFGISLVNISKNLNITERVVKYNYKKVREKISNL